jgi:hypothetical protein
LQIILPQLDQASHLRRNLGIMIRNVLIGGGPQSRPASKPDFVKLFASTPEQHGVSEQSHKPTSATPPRADPRAPAKTEGAAAAPPFPS